ncbi:MAG: ASCH domain-containing protein [Planctomycetota bacterium]|nr:ASCH domain-containing protein [Planctomycetota bacterium]
MSFFHTQKQVRNQSKTQTRRLGWEDAKAGDTVMAIVKGQGLKKGEKVERIAQIVFTRVWREPLNHISQEDVIKEGFPALNSAQFVAMFCRHMKCIPRRKVTCIEFKYVSARKRKNEAA